MEWSSKYMTQNGILTFVLVVELKLLYIYCYWLSSFNIHYLHLLFLQLFEWMQLTGKTNVSSYSSYIKFMGRGLNPLKALEIYNNIQEASTKNNVFICNSVLNCLVRNGKFDTSVALFHQMKNDGLCPDTVTYSTVCIFNS